MSQDNRLSVGAALLSFDIPKYSDWLLSENRDLEIQDPCMPAILDSDWRPLAGLIKSQLDGYTGRMGVHGPFYGVKISAFDTKIQQTIRDRMMQALEFVEQVQATHMVIHSPFEYFGNQFLNLTKGKRLQLEIEATHSTLKGVVSAAADLGCTIVIENIFDKNPAMLLALVKSFESDYVKMSLDVGHALVMHKMGGGPSPDQWVAAAGEHLGHVHLQDTDGLEDRHWPPGKGDINFYALFEELKKLENTPRLILEMDKSDWITEGYDSLKAQGLAK